jgi:hypothetical protein
MQTRLSSAQLRRELGARNLELAQGIVHESTYGAIPSMSVDILSNKCLNFQQEVTESLWTSGDADGKLGI